MNITSCQLNLLTVDFNFQSFELLDQISSAEPNLRRTHISCKHTRSLPGKSLIKDILNISAIQDTSLKMCVLLCVLLYPLVPKVTGPRFSYPY